MASTKHFHAIGLMSGTSLDGLDICYCQFSKSENNWHFELLAVDTLPYSKDWEKKLRNAIHYSAEDLYQLSSDYGFLLGEETSHFIKKNNIQKLDVVGSHGHTVFHQPHKKFTVQIGDGRAIQQLVSCDIVYDFRMQDVIQGGNGAPLVPIGDQLLFNNYDACINLGGFSNISFNKNGQRMGYDIVPVNIVLNQFAQKLGQDYDKSGLLARKGSVIDKLLNQLNQIDFYTQKAPKSLGAEWLTSNVLPLLESYDSLDVLATFTEHAALQIANNISQYHLKNVLITGGGCHNCYLIEKIKAKTNASINIPSQDIINYKEALIFAFMAVLKMTGDINILSSVTGSDKDHSSGIYLKY